jgi:hypothetical protein
MKKKIFTYLALAFSFALNAQWSHVGPIKDNSPGNLFQSGRLDCIIPSLTFNGTSAHDTLYAGSATGSLWMTKDFCASWNLVTLPNSIPYHGVSAITASPSRYLIIATVNMMGPGPMGPTGNIYQYFPWTSSWVASNFTAVSGTGQVTVQHMAICPSNPSIVLAAASNGVYRSADGGITWALVHSGAFENVKFIPAAFNTSGFVLYASGSDIIFSNDLGLTYTSKTAITSLMTTTTYSDMSATFNVSNPHTQYIYFDGIDVSHRIIRLSIDKITDVETIDDYGFTGDNALSTGRACIGAYDKEVYFGCGGLSKYNMYGTTAALYYPNSGAADALNTSYAVPYWSPCHPDNHDILILPSQHTIIYVNDGGCWKDSYTDGGSGIYTNSWSDANNNLNISQILGLSCAESDTTEFITGEQDTYGFVTNHSSETFYVSGNTEPSNVLIDKYDNNNFFHSVHATSEEVTGYMNGSWFDQTPYFPNPTGGDICNASVSTCGTAPNTFSCFPGPEFGSNTMYQNPNEAGGMFMGDKNSSLLEMCTTSAHFTVKKQFYPYNWQEYVDGMAFSKANKNAVYVLLSNRNYPPADTAMPRVYLYNDVDFDNSWAGHNDNWLDVSPSYNVAPFTIPETSDYAVAFSGVAASDWTPSTIWVAISAAPMNPSLKVITRIGGVWQDYSSGIPLNETVMSLVYEQGSNDQLYVGTNTNVYYRNAAMSSWAVYSGNLPNIAMTQLRINNTDNTLRAGTYGLGMWKSPLSCPASTTLNINGTSASNNFYEASHAVTVQNFTQTAGDDKYRSGTNVDLLPNTFITASSTCTAFLFIHGCSGPGNTFRKPGADVETEEFPQKAPVVESNLVRIYPNPSQGRFTIDFSKEGERDITVYSMNEQEVYHSHTFSQTNDLDLTNLSSGIYFVRVTGTDGVTIHKIIIQ